MIGLLHTNQPWNIKIIGLLLVLSFLLIGFSLNVVIYTSLQWVVYFLVGALLNLGNDASEPHEQFINQKVSFPRRRESMNGPNDSADMLSSRVNNS